MKGIKDTETLRWLEDSWNEVLNNWEDDQAHKRFITLCTATRHLDFAGGCYRQIGEKDEEKKQEAEQRIASIWTLSVEMLSELKTPISNRRRKLFLTALILSGSMLFYVLWMLVQ